MHDGAHVLHFASVLNFFPFQRRSAPLATPSAELLALFTGVPNAAGEPVTPLTAMRSSATAAAVRVIAESVGQLPVHVFRKNADGSRERDTTHTASTLLGGDANPWTSSAQLRTQVQTDALLHRNGGFIKIVRAGAKVTELHRLIPTSITPEWNPDNGEPQYRVSSIDGTTEILNWRDVIHIATPGATFDRPLCLIEVAREAISLDLVMSRYQAKLFANGARPSGVLSTDQKISDLGLERLRKAWSSAHAGGENSGRTAILESGLKWEALALSSTDAQFLELRKLTIEEIARIFKVPATLLGILDRATWRNVEELARQFLQTCLMPWLEVWQSAFDRALFAPNERGTFFTEFVLDDLLRGDTASRYAALRQAVGGAWLTPNEARQLDNKPPIDGGDDLILQAGQTAPVEPPADTGAADQGQGADTKVAA